MKLSPQSHLPWSIALCGVTEPRRRNVGSYVPDPTRGGDSDLSGPLPFSGPGREIPFKIAFSEVNGQA